MVALPALAGGQESQNLNLYYRYPVSIGFRYLPLSSVTEMGGSYQVTEFGGEVRVPLPEIPILQPLATGGVTLVDDVLGGDTRDHQRLFAAVGLGIAHRLSREFEIGGSIALGASISQFPNLITDAGGNFVPTSTVNGLAAMDLSLALNPSFNTSISIQPGFRYNYNVGDFLDGYDQFPDFDGLSFGIGISVSYRFGQDPDAAGFDVRALRIGDRSMPPVFAAMQSVYVEEPVTTIELTNVENRQISDLEILFFQNGYMDSPTPSGRVEALGAGESIEVPLYASYNRAVFETNGITPLTGEIIAQYTFNGRPVEQRIGVTYDLYDRNSLTWDDDRKVAAFITPSDSAVRNYASFIRTSNRDTTNDYVSEALQFAMQTYVTLAEQGLLYQVDPSSPFTQVQENTQIVDSISLPRETLSRITGDCDDITVLFNTIMETAGYESAFVTIPGHIYSAVNTSVSAAEYDLVHPDRDMTLIIDGEVWALIEITLIGQSTFMEAWAVGMRQWQQYDEAAAQRGFYRTRDAQQLYRPVGLVERDLGLQYPEQRDIQQGFENEFQRLSGLLLAPYRDVAEERNDHRSWNRYGVRAAMIGRLDLARTAFQRSIALDRERVDPLINLGSVEYLNGEYQQALRSFERAAQTLETLPRAQPATRAVVFLNLAKAAYRLENYEQASQYYDEAATYDPEQVSQFAYIGAGVQEGGARASEAASGPPILFADGGD
jgi:hypothetical protein